MRVAPSKYHVLFSLGDWQYKNWITHVDLKQKDQEFSVELLYEQLEQSKGKGGSFEEIIYVNGDFRSKSNKGNARNYVFFKFKVPDQGCLKIVVRQAKSDQIYGTAYMMICKEDSCERKECLPVMGKNGQLVAEINVGVVVGDALSLCLGLALSATLNGPLLFKPTEMKAVQIGHRGFGSTARRFGVAENTVMAFAVAKNQGVQWVEFDVQLTSDNIPILYHDYYVPVKGDVKVSVDSLTVKDIETLNPRPPGSEKSERDAFLKAKATSSRHFDTRNLSSLSFAVHGGYPTLKQVFKEVAADVCFNLEFKYDDPKLNNKHKVNRNFYVNTILKVVAENCKERKLIFSSFDPDVCFLLKEKQSRFPVFLITETGQLPAHDFRRNELQEAIWWVKMNNYEGVVCEIDHAIPDLPVLQKTMADGFAVFTYGSKNDEKGIYQMQKEKGINGIICDFHAASKE